MKIPRIIRALDYVSDEKIAEAAIDPINQNPKKRSALPLLYSLGGVSAAAAAVLGVVLLNGKPVSEPPVITSSDALSSVSSDIPSEPDSATDSQTESSGGVSEPATGVLPDDFTPYEGSGFTIDYDNLPFEYDGNAAAQKFNAELMYGAMGFEGFYAYDVSELIGNNPWSEDLEITELPVFTGGLPDITRTELSADLPDGYSLKEGADAQTKIKTVRYLAEKYSDELGYTDYELDVTREYNVYYEPRCFISLYESSDNAFDAIMNYNFKSSHFYYDSLNDKIVLSTIGSMDQYACIGFYPVITADTAREMLLEGKYSTSVPESECLKDGVNEDRVKHVELRYHAAMGGTQIPYYRFLVELDENEHMPGINQYGAFYVPAISPEYLEGMDTDARYM